MCYFLTAFVWHFTVLSLADYPNKSYPYLGVKPSRGLVKYSRANPWFSNQIPFPFGGLRDPWVQIKVILLLIRQYRQKIYKQLLSDLKEKRGYGYWKGKH